MTVAMKSRQAAKPCDSSLTQPSMATTSSTKGRWLRPLSLALLVTCLTTQLAGCAAYQEGHAAINNWLNERIVFGKPEIKVFFSSDEFHYQRLREIKDLKEAADKGDLDAKIGYARYLVVGEQGFPPQDLPTAVKIFEEGAAAGKPAAKVGLAERYIFGDYPEGSQPDYDKALPLINEAAKAGDRVALYWRYLFKEQGLIKPSTPEEAAEIDKGLKTSAEAGFTPAQLLVVEPFQRNNQEIMAYQEGIIADWDWTTYMATHNVPRAAAIMGDHFARVFKVQKDPEAMVKEKYWYEKGALEGDAKSEKRLGDIYAQGSKSLDLEPNKEKARALYESAAKKGYLPANVAMVEQDLYDKKITPAAAEPLLFDYCKRGAAEGCALLAKNYRYGFQGFPKDAAKEKLYGEEGCKRGNRDACPFDSPEREDVRPAWKDYRI